MKFFALLNHPIHDFLPNWMIFFHLLSTWLSDLYITKNCVFCLYTTAEKRKFDFFQSLNHVDVNLKPHFLIKSGYYIVPSPSTALIEGQNGAVKKSFEMGTICRHKKMKHKMTTLFYQKTIICSFFIYFFFSTH